MGSIAEPVVSDTALSSHVPESFQTPSAASTNKLFSLANRTIAITGGGRGLGITLALAVVEAGGHAACIDILPTPSPSEWASLQKLANRVKLTVSYHQCDITDEDSISATLDRIGETGAKSGAPLYGTIACAGIQQKVPAVEYPVDGFRRIMDVNVTGTFLTTVSNIRRGFS
jgi:NAD(P)-dependent dehydrogenase (short-subunit alcohol dehydrogenase family)